MSERTARIEELLREEISRVITREVQDPRVGFVTVTSVDVAPDLSHATVWVSLIGGPEERQASLSALGRAMPYVRRRLGVLRLRRIPELHLRRDDSIERGTRVLRIIQELAEGDEPVEPAFEETLPTPAGTNLPTEEALREPSLPPLGGQPGRWPRPGGRGRPGDRRRTSGRRSGGRKRP